MTNRPILFSGPMVRAILEGRKAQTRRILKIRGHKAFSEFGPSDTKGYDWHFRDAAKRWHDLRDCDLRQRLEYAPGDRLWVRETWCPHYLGDGVWNLDVSYAADGQRRTIMDGEFGDKDWSWPKAADRGNVSPLFMPRWASRLTLTVTDVRVQRLQDISEEDAWAEGCVRGDPDHVGGFFPAEEPDPSGIGHRGWDNARDWFADLWNSLNAKRGFGWEANPWVCAVSFEVQKINIDQSEAVHG